MFFIPLLCVLHPIWVLGGGGAPKGSRTQLAYAIFHPQQLKMEISEADFFDTLTIQNGQISYVKHFLAPLYVFFRPLVVNLHVVRLPS